MKRYVLTGGPCAGKTTIIDILAKRGYAILPELARDLIEKEMAKGSDVLPWKNAKKFQEIVAWKQWRREFFAPQSEALFLDRGLIDGYGYAVLEKVTIPKIITLFGKGRYDKIFLLDPIPSYQTDGSRIEDRNFARAVHEEIRKAYVRFGYEVIAVPMMTPNERVEFVLRNL